MQTTAATQAVDIVRRGGGKDRAAALWALSADVRSAVLGRMALRTKDDALLDALVLRVSGGTRRLDGLAGPLDAAQDAHEVLGALADGEVRDPVAAMWLGAVLAGRGMSTAWSRRGLAVMDAVARVHRPSGLPFQLCEVLVQQALLSGEPDLAEHHLRNALNPDLRLDLRRAVETDLAHPALPGRDPQQWLRLINRPFRERGLSPVRIDTSAPTLFDGLRGTAGHAVQDGPLVTVIMPAWQPDEGLVTSVQSILDQTWRNLEVLVADDASGPGFDELFDRVGAMDERVRIVRMPRNGGSYVARNHCLTICRGEFVTVQDADDWSHPERIERHVRHLMASPDVPANTSVAIRAKDDLTHMWLGYTPTRTNASSLFVRREVFEAIGGFHAVRKGADSEYHARITHLIGPVGTLPDELAITRLRTGSLSRGDFTWSWMHPDRVHYRASFRAWHRQLLQEAGDDLSVARRLAAASGVDRTTEEVMPVPRGWNRGLPGHDGTRPQSDDVVRIERALWGDLSRPRHREHVLLATHGRGTALWHQVPGLPGDGLFHEIHPDTMDAALEAGHGFVSSGERTHVADLVVLDPRVLETLEGLRVSADRVHLPVGGDDLPAPTDPFLPAEQVRRSFGVAPDFYSPDELPGLLAGA